VVKGFDLITNIAKAFTTEDPENTERT
jgi:hypothetical protein